MSKTIPLYREKALSLIVVLALSAGAPRAEQVIELPDFGDSAGAIISPEKERKIGESIMQRLRRDAPIVVDEEVEEYIQNLGMSVGENAGYYNQLEFFVIDHSAINAFAIPGGFIGIHSGLILNSKSESEVASVLAHEVVHLTQRHTARMIEAQSRLSIPSMAALAGALILAAVNPEAGMAAMVGVQAAQQQYAINFTRDNEREADRIGIQLLYDAGYDTHAMARFFERLQRANRYTDPSYIPEYLRTHPVTVNRIAEAKERANRQPPTSTRDESYEYSLIWTKLKVLTARDPAQAKYYYQNALREGEYRYENIAKYGYMLAMIEAGDLQRARVESDKLLAAFPDVQAFRLAAAKLEMKANNPGAAIAHYQLAIERNPDSRASNYGYVQALIQNDQPGIAKTALRDYGLSDRRDPKFYHMLAEAEQKLGQRANAHFSLAEYYEITGWLHLAVEQLKLANHVPEITNYQRHRVEARMDAIEKEIAYLEGEEAKQKDDEGGRDEQGRRKERT